MAHKSLASFVESAKEKDSYWVEHAKFDFAMDLVGLLHKSGMSNNEFAERINVKAPYISKVLRGDENLTIQTMVKLVRALKGKLNIHVSEEDCHVRWFDVVAQKNKVTQSNERLSGAVEEWAKRSYTTTFNSSNPSAANDYDQAESFAA